mgnify:CR=1 FL=1
MKFEKPLPGMNTEETERQLHYMNAVIMFKVIHSRGIINEKEVENQANVNEYEEVGLYGFEKARENDPSAGLRCVYEKQPGH